MSTLVTEEWHLPLGAARESALRRYLDSHPAAHFRQSLEWLWAVGPARMRVFVTRRGERIVAASLVEFSSSRLPFATTARIGRGPLFDDQQAFAAHLDSVRREVAGQANNLRISPFVAPTALDLPDGWQPVAASAFYATTLIAPIQQTQEEQWRTLRRSTRTSINRARQGGLEIETACGEDSFRRFARHYNDFAARRSLAPLDENTLARLGSFASNSGRLGRCLLLEARIGESRPGGALFVLNGRTLAYEWGWTDLSNVNSRLPLLHPLLWHALGVCHENALPELDLGGYLAESGNDDPINHVKLGFSKNERHFMPEMRLVLAPARQAAADAFGRLRRLIGRKP